MILNIDNLGTVKSARIDLSKRLTLFCGRNSTGKTYVSYILHAFLTDGKVFKLDSAENIARQILENRSFQIEKSIIDEWLSKNCQEVINQLGSVFAISDNTKEKLFSDFNLSVDFNDKDYQDAINNTVINAQMSDGQYVWKIEKKAGEIQVSVECNVDDSSVMSSGSFRLANLLCNIFRDLTLGKDSGVRMLTVERNSIYTFKTELSLSRNELIDRIQSQSGKSELDIIDIINSSSRRYPLAVRSSLRVANDLENVQKAESPYTVVSRQIEEDILGGEVSMTKNGDVEFHAKSMIKSKRLPFHLSSSIVKTMASLVIYLRHMARPSDTLIIDEPEMNFHPDVQVVLARIFAILVNNGLKVVVSTHSDYIVREFNNLIMAGAIAAKGDMETVTSLGYTPDMLIRQDELSVLLFKLVKRNTVNTVSLEIDDEGFAVESIDDTIQKQNITAETLYAKLCSEER